MHGCVIYFCWKGGRKLTKIEKRFCLKLKLGVHVCDASVFVMLGARRLEGKRIEIVADCKHIVSTLPMHCICLGVQVCQHLYIFHEYYE